jgi:Flp pilus assembly protein TadG
MYNASQRVGFKRAQRGIAAIEMAITLPVLLLLLVGTAELGRAFYQYNTVTKSIRTAVRYLADHAIDDTSGVVQLSAEKQTAAKNLTIYATTSGGGEPIVAGLDAGDVTVTQIDSSHFEVTVNFNYQPIFLRIPTFGYSASDVDTGLALTASVTMRVL